jgi:hypothetical protein
MDARGEMQESPTKQVMYNHNPAFEKRGVKKTSKVQQ